jgi:ABC-type uncharacterized transport system permease subunit
MNQKDAIYLFAGLAIGALFGFLVGSANGNPLLGLGFGALAGVFIGWFVAASLSHRAG